MIKVFLSHSSSDKDKYVHLVAAKIGIESCVYDEYTFEAGMQPLEEIIKGLSESQLFVVFLSEKALDSSWVQKEILLAQNQLTESQLQRVYPIIIDSNITHDDARIPQWIKDDYNLKYVSRPTVAARRIRQRMREISWLRNPAIKELDEIFVGRNELINAIELRVDNFDLELPVCFIASGLPHIGRYALLRRALIKCNIVRQTYEFPSISLRREESLEDFILKLYDLGFSDIDYPKNLMSIDIGDRINIAEKVTRDIQKVKEIVIIHDEGCIINPTVEVQSWFDEILKRISTTQRPTFIIASRYRPPEQFRSPSYMFSVNVPELSFSERKGLFKRLLEYNKLSLARDDFSFFTGLFYGYPDQVRFGVDLVRDLGIEGAKYESHQITEYNTDKAAAVLNKYSNQQNALDFLFLLSEFEFVSLDFLFSIVNEKDYGYILEDLVLTCICDYVGVEKEFVRLNDAVRDYVRRNRLELPDKFKTKLKDHLDTFLDGSDEEDRDISDLLYSIKKGIKEGRSVPEDYLIPSHFLKSMRELYQEYGNLDRVVELADRLLEKEHLLDKSIANDVRYYLCLSLARKRDKRMLNEVQRIQGAEHNFLLGFYYRLQGRPEDAIKKLKECIGFTPVEARAKRELVQVLLSIEDYEKASELAKSNYEENRKNAFQIQAYFNSLINSGKAFENKELLKRLVSELKSIHSEVSMQMADIAHAEYLVKCEGNYVKAKDAINDAVQKYPDSHYPLLCKAFLAARNKDVTGLRDAYNTLYALSKRRAISEDSLARLKSYLLVLEGDLPGALEYAENHLKRCPDDSRANFKQRLHDLHNSA